MNDFQHESEIKESYATQPVDDTVHSEDRSSGTASPIKLFVGSLPYDVCEGDLISIFDKFGEVVEFTILRDRFGKSKGCAALCYASTESAETCIKTLHNRFCCGNVPTPLQVKYFQKREHAPVTCFVQGLPYCFSVEAIWSSLSAHYGPVSNVSLDPAGNPFSAYVSFYKRASAFSLSNDSRTAGIFIDGMLCPSTHVTILKFPTMAPMPYHAVAWQFPIEGLSPQLMVDPLGLAPPPPPTDDDTPTKLFVGCLPYSKTAQDIADLFSEFGTLVEVAILTDYSGKSRGAAFVTFSKAHEAKSAVEHLSGFCFPKSTRPLNISYAHKHMDSPGWSPSSNDPNTPVCEEHEIVA